MIKARVDLSLIEDMMTTGFKVKRPVMVSQGLSPGDRITNVYLDTINHEVVFVIQSLKPVVQSDDDDDEPVNMDVTITVQTLPDEEDKPDGE